MSFTSLKPLAFLASLALIGAGPAQSSPRPMIVGGNYVQVRQYTATVALRYNLDRSVLCTGTVIADYWVLTADHCLWRPDGSGNRVAIPLDSFFISPGRMTGKEPDAMVVQRIDYPGNAIDVALIKSNTKLTSATVSAAPVASQTPTSGSVTMVGWGLTGWASGSPAKRLMKLALQIAACPPGISTYSFCTKALAEGVNKGDSGGPVFTGTPQAPTLVGVINMNRHPYSVFAKSEAFYQWVRNNAK